MTQLKICGVRSQEDYNLVSKSGAHFAGFIFAPSKREVTPEAVSQWIEGSQRIRHVGVFVNPSLEKVLSTLEVVQLDVIQLHGKESIDFIDELKSITGIQIWKALPHSDRTLEVMESFLNVVDGFVIDTKVKGKWGGTGIRFDWTTIPAYTTFANKHDKHCFIAGGISPENMKECLTFEPIGIDLSSGVEKNERKDPNKIDTLTERMKEYGHNISR